MNLLDEPIDPRVPRPTPPADSLWWMHEHTLEILKCLERLRKADATTEERDLTVGFLESHMTALWLSHDKYQEFLRWMNDPKQSEDTTNRDDWDPEESLLPQDDLFEDEAQEDGA
jgi:hypothetical protein